MHIRVQQAELQSALSYLFLTQWLTKPWFSEDRCLMDNALKRLGWKFDWIVSGFGFLGARKRISFLVF
jgi:hypothetical protein